MTPTLEELNEYFRKKNAMTNNVYEFKSKVTIEFNRVTEKFDVIKNGRILGSYDQYTPATMRADYENSK